MSNLLTRHHQILAAVAMVKKAWAMPLRGHSAGLRPEPPTASQPKAAVVIAGALHDWRGLSIVGLILALTIFAYGAMA